jgi:predicted AlkP superfamily phosphohydrolase/phosphomutase
LTDRLLIVGWDGADWEILDDLLSRGCLPTVETMIRDGARGNLDSTIPSHSWAAWTSFLTGLHPASHGVYDFVERHPTEPQRRVPVGSASIKAPTFLETLSDHGLEVRSANVPVTFPPFPVNGRLISGVAIPHSASFVHPADWSAELQRRAPFPINGMEWGRFRDDPPALIAEVRRLVEERTASYRVLLEGDWNVAVCVYVAPDRLQHPMGNHLLPSHPDFRHLAETPNAQAIRDVFRALDESLAGLIEASGPDTTVVLMSDHGFRPVERLSNLNRLLERLGFMAPSRTASATMGLRRSGLARAIARTRLGHAMKRRIKAPSTLDWSRTRAYQSVSGGGINVNLRGREPGGTVPQSEYEVVRTELRDALLAYRDGETGEPIVGQVRFREDLPPGPFSDLAPDVIASPTSRWSFAHSDSISSPARWPSGSHRTRGIVVANGGRTRPGTLGDRYIADLGATALAFCGVSADGLDGRVIKEVAGESPDRSPLTADASLGAPPEARRRFDRGDSGMSEEDNEVVAQHLRDLGYIE